MKRAALALGLLVVLVPSGLSLGTEELPELPDTSGDVSYNMAYPPPHDHTYLDLLAAWFDYDDATDQTSFTIKVADGQKLRAPPPGLTVLFRVDANLTALGEEVGQIAFSWIVDPNATSRSSIFVSRTQGAYENVEYIEHEATSSLEAPAYFRFVFARVDVLEFGDQAEHLRGASRDLFGSLPVACSGCGIPLNSDSAASDAIYSFKELRQVRQAGPVDPLENLPSREAATPSSSEANRSSAPGFLAAFAIVAAAAAVLRRR